MASGEHVSSPLHKERHASLEHPTVTDRDPNREVTAGEDGKRPQNSLKHAGIITTTPESTGTLIRTTEATSNDFSSIVHVGENQSKEPRSHPSSGSHHHNEPFTHLGHSRGNQMNHPILAFPAITIEDDRNSIKTQTTRSKAGNTPSRGLPCTRNDNHHTLREPPRLSSLKNLRERRERKSTIPPSEYYNFETKSWNLELISEIIYKDDIPTILDIKISKSGRRDEYCWKHTTSEHTRAETRQTAPVQVDTGLRYKCQVDGSWSEKDKCMGMGFPLMEAGVVILQGQKCTHRVQSPLKTEAEALI
ncbi:hypothetical protein IGI04_002503 [Brassica rapa subsp. trilocularis]|uniref:Uncharacterized protein n=1 Tax=Brassica rapa subsp. trilocularis TaxID=1813537 RepID=A0ABQ7NXV7_BRACM|nr:hypothetical protein IGI04_002503 [Brassica rapa subsp. trilocularis]